MLRAIQQVRGRVPARMLRKGAFTAEHFTPDGDFLAVEKDKVRARARARAAARAARARARAALPPVR